MPTLAILLTAALALSTLIGLILGFYRRGPPASPQTPTGPPPATTAEAPAHEQHPTTSNETVGSPENGDNPHIETPASQPEPPTPTLDEENKPTQPTTPASAPPAPAPADEKPPVNTTVTNNGSGPQDIEKMVIELKKQGLSARAIARQIGRSPSYVYRVLKRHGLSGGSSNGKARSGAGAKKTSRRQKQRKTPARAAPAPA